MSGNVRSVLFQVAGYLKLIAEGITPNPSKSEAAELLDKIGELLSHDDTEAAAERQEEPEYGAGLHEEQRQRQAALARKDRP